MARQVAAVPETTVRLRANGLRVATWTCTPAALEALAAGRLLHEGYIRTADDLLALRTLPEQDGILGVDAELRPAGIAAAAAEAEHRAEHGCGPRFLLDCRPDLIRSPGDAPHRSSPPDPAMFQPLFRALFNASPARGGSGGHHAAALSDGERLHYLHEEVGRHNAVDKAIGAALLERADRGALGLVLSARISGAIAAKAARAGLGWIASRSVPTTLAVEIAAVGGLPIIARAAGPDARVFAPETVS